MKKGRMFAALAVISTVWLFAGCTGGVSPVQTDIGFQPATETTLSLEKVEEQTRESLLWEDCYAYAFSTLSEAEQIWYRDMAAALGIMSTDAKLSEEGLEQGLDETCVDKVFQCVLIDHPELFYVEGYSYTKYTVGEKIVSIEFTGTYSIDWDEACDRAHEIAKEAERIHAAAPQSDDDYERIKYIYDTLVLETDYDRNASDNQNVYSVFVGHASVCQGYAKAFQYLLERMDMDCTLVQGDVWETGEGHAWNLVRADGEFYYVDVTWGDISYRNLEETEEEAQVPELPEWISYDYLCITTEQLLRTHLPDDSMELPLCTAVDDNYYVREKAFFTQYDKAQMEDLVNRRIEEGRQTEEGDVVLALCCADETCYEEVCTKLLDTQELFRYLEGTGINTFIYSTDDKQYTLTFFMVTTTQ
ncbi:MAG: hypothetical protein IJ794_18735 [Lachnospiraceae bacterium]|nr:hypothetical protein [Lachnospiraceae bacterium]